MGAVISSKADRLSRNCRAAIAGIALVLAGCAQSAPPDAPETHDAPRVVSLNPCLDAILVEVADPEQILALSHYSGDRTSSSIAPEIAARFTKSGGTVEEVLALDPDLVLASTFIAPSTRNALERLGVRIATFDSPGTIAESKAQIRQIGELLGQGLNAELLVRDIDRAWVERDRPSIATLLWQPGQIVPGEATLVSELLARNGFASHSAAQGLGQADYVSLEALLANPPDLVLVAGSSRGQQHPLLGKLEQTKVEALEPRLLYCGGPTIIALQQRLDEIRADMS
jgi:iron complex transport system substrate-binding protein